MNYEFNLMHHVGVVAKRVCEAAAAETAAHEGDDNTTSGPTGRGVKTGRWYIRVCLCPTDNSLKQVPLVFAVTTGRKQRDYEKVLEAVSVLLPDDINLKRAETDFEDGL